jgi:hypothetical protein
LPENADRVLIVKIRKLILEVEENAALGNNDSLFIAGAADDGAGRRSRPQVGLVVEQTYKKDSWFSG